MLLVTLTVISACTATRQDTTQSGLMDLQQPNAGSALAGTAWQLVEIVSMDDHVYAPEDRSLYTLAFNADGSMRVGADCNLGIGTWTSASTGQLQFGRIAATQALCLPDSLHDRYMAQFQWVRSYVMRDGRLFLSTMADGSIIEFEPTLEK
jgi:para-nitrobenzyl esterase